MVTKAGKERLEKLYRLQRLEREGWKSYTGYKGWIVIKIKLKSSKGYSKFRLVLKRIQCLQKS